MSLNKSVTYVLDSYTSPAGSPSFDGSLSFFGLVVVMLARSRLAIYFCALNAFRAVGVEVWWMVSLRLPSCPPHALAVPVIPYVGQW